jgi:hypothetical protein
VKHKEVGRSPEWQEKKKMIPSWSGLNDKALRRNEKKY